ncbi:ABC transporter permease [uncultured Duncaniella sp.]|uniref:ABC transporter permease n=1 Tax=uncultured Duncaniella sp. TaxID=2768039 RepID=UPI0025A99252|nr:ABC transporter permease [uncultured Duncaniella sp.]
MDWIKSLFRVWRRETRLVFTDIGVLLFFFGLPIAYPVVYTLIYNPEVVKKMDTVVVDNSRSAESRELVRELGATQSINVIGYASDINEAKRAWHEKKCYGVIEIPADYARKIGRGEQAVASFYCDMSLLLRYRQYLFSITDVQMNEALRITSQRLSQGGLITSTIEGLPVNSQANFLGDVTQGFASFVMPGIVVLILQQSMLLGITMIAGTARDRRRRNGGIDPLGYDAGPLATVLGKSLCYMMIYIPLAYYILEIIPYMFALPHVGTFWNFMPVVFVFLLATTFLGQTLQVFVRERESSLLVIVFTSVVFLFLSGLTWPRYAFNKFWYMISELIPSTLGIEALIRINSNGSTISHLGHYYWRLWALTGLYFVTALTLRYFAKEHGSHECQASPMSESHSDNERQRGESAEVGEV